MATTPPKIHTPRIAPSMGTCAGDDIRIHEDAGTDDPAHHDHRDVEEIQLASEGQEDSK